MGFYHFMATYAIGDLQGCFAPLKKLIKKIDFDPKHDKLWFTGDIVNRGHDSLGTLRFVKEMVENKLAATVLGNHDLHLIAVASGIRELKSKDTFHDILEAHDLEELIVWLRQQPLLHTDIQHKYVMVHAGIAPHWSLVDAQHHNEEVIHVLRGKHYRKLLQHMYSETSVSPRHWDTLLSKWERYRLIIDYFTRMRFCNAEGQLELKVKGNLKEQPSGYYPWFRVPDRVNTDLHIIFGHWASLKGKVEDEGIYALDTGCIWGNCLTAMRLEDQKIFSVPCEKQAEDSSD
jgi:bis(5'-nucleosyl)-tetraphosphatase (symmetrical)